MRKYSRGKNPLKTGEVQKKYENISLLRNEFLKNPKIQERSRSFNEVEKNLKEKNNVLSNVGEKDRFYVIESRLDKIDIKLGKINNDIVDIKEDIGEMKNTMDTLLLLSLSKDTYCPVNQKIKINNILKKQREKILRKFNNTNPNNEIDNQINPNIPNNASPIRKKIKTHLKNDKPLFSNKYEY